ncbi:MAG: iron ABC transporter permease [Staphylococcus epidermidis]|nr:iron ABC transporter permease [Staphylococcus epidermidis]
MTMVNKDSQSAIEQKKKKRTTLTFIVGVCLLFISVYLNLAIGSSKIQFNDILSYVTGHTNTKATFLIHNVRMPRMLAGLIIGGALAIAGLLMQAITKNPLASPQIFGVNAGASFVIVLITVLIPSLGSYLALAGMAIHLFFSSMTQGIIILNEDSNDTVMFWLVGSLAGIKWQQIIFILPFLLLAIFVTIFMGRQLTILELGDDIARGLGQRTEIVRMIVGILVVVLAGVSVSIAGPIGFVGLIVPHIVKRYINKNYVLMIPLTFIFGATLLLISDVLCRLITYPFESPVGIVTSFVGAFYFLFITVRGVNRI